jgi:hypothetical protein
MQLMEASNKHDEILHMARSAVHYQLPLFQHGVPLLVQPSKPPPFVARWCGGVVVEDPTFTGNVFSDGSVIGGCRRGDERSGWAAVCITALGEVIFGAYGTCPDYFPTSLRAELWALLQVLRHAQPPVTIWVDNAGVVDGFGRGRQWCVASCRPAADLWSLVWQKVEDLGGADISVVKVKGHATVADIEAGRSTLWQKAGNDHVDHFAKRGSQLAEHLSSTADRRQASRIARGWYKWLAVLVSNWPADTQGQTQSERSRKRKRKAVAEEAAAEGGAEENAELVAEVEVAESAAKRPRKSASIAAPTPESSTTGLGAGHELYRSGAVIWCRLCGCYGEQRLKNLKLPCGGLDKSTKAGQLGRLVRGEHPLRKGERLPRPVRFTGS